jgi:hypothetical protein
MQIKSFYFFSMAGNIRMKVLIHLTILNNNSQQQLRSWVVIFFD